MHAVLMWNDMVQMGVSVPDKVIRTIAVFVVLAVLLRIGGKRDLAQLNTFDLVVMLLLSNVVQNAIIGPDNSLTGGLLGAAALLLASSALNRLVRRSDRAAHLIEGTETVLARDGVWDERALRHQGLRQADVDAAVRRQNTTGVDDAEMVVLDPGGSLVVTMRESSQPATQADLTRLEAKVDRLLAATGPG